MHKFDTKYNNGLYQSSNIGKLNYDDVLKNLLYDLYNITLLYPNKYLNMINEIILNIDWNYVSVYILDYCTEELSNYYTNKYMSLFWNKNNSPNNKCNVLYLLDKLYEKINSDNKMNVSQDLIDLWLNKKNKSNVKKTDDIINEQPSNYVSKLNNKIIYIVDETKQMIDNMINNLLDDDDKNIQFETSMDDVLNDDNNIQSESTIMITKMVNTLLKDDEPHLEYKYVYHNSNVIKRKNIEKYYELIKNNDNLYIICYLPVDNKRRDFKSLTYFGTKKIYYFQKCVQFPKRKLMTLYTFNDATSIGIKTQIKFKILRFEVPFNKAWLENNTLKCKEALLTDMNVKNTINN